MGLKPVELQVAIHRTGEVGTIQNQLSQKPIHDQAMLAAAAARQMEDMRKKSHAANRSDEDVNIKRDGSQSSDREANPHVANKQKSEAEEPIEHPYKGHHIDLSL